MGKLALNTRRRLTARWKASSGRLNADSLSIAPVCFSAGSTGAKVADLQRPAFCAPQQKGAAQEEDNVGQPRTQAGGTLPWRASETPINVTE